MANGEIVAVGILGTLVSIIYFCFYLTINLGKDRNNDLEQQDSLLKSHYPLRFFFLFFGIFLMYILLYQGYSFGQQFLPLAEEPFYSLVTLLTFTYAFFMVTYFIIYFMILGLEHIGLYAKIKHRWRMK